MKHLAKRSQQRTIPVGYSCQPIRLRIDPPKQSTHGLGWFVLVMIAAIVSLITLFHHQNSVQPTAAQWQEFHQEQTRRLINQGLVRQYDTLQHNGGVAYGVEQNQ